MELVAQGAVAVRGNHDQAVNSSAETMNAEAQIAIEWTRGRLDTAQRRFLGELSGVVEGGDRLFVHSEASSPRSWHIFPSTPHARKNLIATPHQVTFCGHHHPPATY